MGFRTGAYASVWDVTPVNDRNTKIRISTSNKNKTTGQYEQDFSGFVLCLGTACAAKAAGLTKGARIKLGDVDTTNRYDSEKKITYTNHKMFSFDVMDSSGGNNDQPETKHDVDGGEIENSKDLPF